MFYRPPELDSMCLWDILRNYVKEKKPKSRTQRKTYLEFKRGHPQHATHCLKKLDAPVIPVLMGYHIPRNDSESDRTKYAVVILALFKLWSDTKSSPLKSPEIAWPDALDDFKRSMSPEHARILLNMQLLERLRKATPSVGWLPIELCVSTQGWVWSGCPIASHQCPFHALKARKAWRSLLRISTFQTTLSEGGFAQALY
jgi:hypothetical protein